MRVDEQRLLFEPVEQQEGAPLVDNGQTGDVHRSCSEHLRIADGQRIAHDERHARLAAVRDDSRRAVHLPGIVPELAAQHPDRGGPAN